MPNILSHKPTPPSLLPASVFSVPIKRCIWFCSLQCSVQELFISTLSCSFIKVQDWFILLIYNFNSRLKEERVLGQKYCRVQPREDHVLAVILRNRK